MRPRREFRRSRRRADPPRGGVAPRVCEGSTPRPEVRSPSRITHKTLKDFTRADRALHRPELPSRQDDVRDGTAHLARVRHGESARRALKSMLARIPLEASTTLCPKCGKRVPCDAEAELPLLRDVPARLLPAGPRARASAPLTSTSAATSGVVAPVVEAAGGQVALVLGDAG